MDPHDQDFLQRRRVLLRATADGNADVLLRGLADPDHRALAAKALARLRHRPATKPLLRLLTSEDPYIRATAVTSLGQIGAEEAVPGLLALAESDPESYVRQWAIVGLADIVAQSTDTGHLVTPHLVRFLGDYDNEVRRTTCLALERIGDERAVVPLRDAASRLPFLKSRIYRRAADRVEKRVRNKH